MAGKGAAAGSTFLTGVLSKLSAEDRQKGEEALKTLQALGGGTVVAAVGDGVLAQEEFSRLTDDLKTRKDELDLLSGELDTRKAGLDTWFQDLTTWHQTNKDLLEEGKKAKGNGNSDPKKAAQPPAGLTDEKLDERMVGERAAFLGFQRDQNLITREHFTKFNEIVDLEPLFKHPQIAQIGLVGVYELVHKDRLTKFSTDAQAKHDQEIADKAVRAHMEKQASMPYPSPTGSGSGSPLDALVTDKKDGVVDAATAHYNRLQAERAGATG